MNTKDEKNVDIEQIIKAAELRLNEISEDELTKVSGGDNNGVVFEKGKWVRDIPTTFREVIAYELLELRGNEILANAWININGYVTCSRNMSLPAIILNIATEIAKPDWVHE